jgi:hypothetical protein
VLPEFQRSFGESLPSFTKSAVCWQFCWQLQLGSSQLVDAQASKLEARVGIEPATENPLPQGRGQIEVAISLPGIVHSMNCLPQFGKDTR